MMFLRLSTILDKLPEDSFLSMVYGSWIRLEFLKGNVLEICNGLDIKNVGSVILFHVILNILSVSMVLNYNGVHDQEKQSTILWSPMLTLIKNNLDIGNSTFFFFKSSVCL